MPRHDAIHTLPLLITLVLPAAAQDERTFDLDAVELVAGRETQGKAELSQVHGNFTYWFCSESNRAEFVKNPERYRIQLGGACGRMGPLSGIGRSDLHAVHAGKIYIFASNDCRKAFVAAADRLLEGDDAKPAPTAQAAESGRALLDAAVQAIGGAERLDALKTYREIHEEKVPYQGSDHLQASRLVLRFPGEVRREDVWDEKVWAAIGGPTDGFFLDEGKLRHMDPDQRAALRRSTARHPLAILEARRSDGFLCAALEPGQIAGLDVERVEVSFDGATTVLGLDPESKRIVATSYTGRGGRRGFLGRLEVAWSDFRTVGGLTLPFTRHVVSHEGVAANGAPRTLTSIDCNPELPADCFARPSAAKQ